MYFCSKPYIMFDTAIKNKLPITDQEAESIGSRIMIVVHEYQTAKPFDNEKKVVRFVMNKPLDNERYLHIHGEYVIEGSKNHMELTDMEVCNVDQFITYKLNEKTLYPPDVIFIQ